MTRESTDERTVRMGDEGPLHNKNREVIAACPACAHAVKRVEHLFNEASRLGLDYPTDKMLEDMVRDAEWNALWNPREIAEQHDQDMREMRRIWNMALGANVVEESELISERDWSQHLRIQLAAEVEKVNKLQQQLAAERENREADLLERYRRGLADGAKKDERRWAAVTKVSERNALLVDQLRKQLSDEHESRVKLTELATRFERELNAERETRDEAVALNQLYHKTRNDHRNLAKNVQQQRDDWQQENQQLRSALIDCCSEKDALLRTIDRLNWTELRDLLHLPSTDDDKALVIHKIKELLGSK